MRLIVRMQLTWLAVGEGCAAAEPVTGGRSRVTAAGSQQRQEWGDAVGPGLGGRGVPVV